jgi:hypothetical protein
MVIQVQTISSKERLWFWGRLVAGKPPDSADESEKVCK